MRGAGHDSLIINARDQQRETKGLEGWLEALLRRIGADRDATVSQRV